MAENSLQPDSHGEDRVGDAIRRLADAEDILESLVAGGQGAAPDQARLAEARAAVRDTLDLLAAGSAARPRDAEPGTAALHAEIAGRVQMKEALRRSEARYHALFNSMTEGFALHEIICDEDGRPVDYRFLDINPAFERLTGLRREDVIGKTHNEVLPGDDPRWVKAYGAVALTGEPTQFENYSPALKRHYEVFAYCPAPRQFAVMFVDITGRRRMEEALRVNLTKYSVLFESFPLGITVSDADGQIVETNKEAERLLSVPSGEHVQRTIGGVEWQVIRPDGTPMPAEEYASVRALNERRRVEDVELGIVKPGGGVTWLSVTAAPLQLEGYGVVVTYGDITERKQAQAALRRQTRNLAALEERQRLARELHDSVSQSIYGIGLGARTARAQLDRDLERVPAALDYVVTLAEMALSDMRALIFDLRPETLKTEGLVSALEKRATFIRNRQGLQVETDLGPEPELPLDVKDALYSVAREALHNAIKHAYAQHVAIRLQQAEDCLEMDVRDDGTGFDPGAAYPGHFGLESMRDRVADIGGSLQIESGPGRGTHVHVRLPV